jgi:hypothetical protein
LQKNYVIGNKKIKKYNLGQIKNLNNFLINKKVNQFRFKLKPTINLRRRKIEFRIFKSTKPNKIQKIILNLKNQLKNYIYDIIIHGSYGDDTYIKNWSDLDILIILKDDVLENHKLMNQFKKRIILNHNKLYKIFPLQHHPFQFITKHFLELYDDSIMPLSAFKKSKSLFNKVINFKYTVNNLNKKKLIERFKYIQDSQNTMIYKHHCKDKKCLDLSFKKKNRLYQLFAYINYILLIPSLFLAYKKKSCHKSQSFTKIKNYLNESDLKIIEKISRIRANWKYKYSYIKKNYITDQLIEDLGYNFFKEAYNFEKRIKKLLND